MTTEGAPWVDVVSEAHGFEASFPESPREEPLPQVAPGVEIRRWMTRGTEESGATHIFADQRPLVALSVCVMAEQLCERLWEKFEFCNIGKALLSSRTLSAGTILLNEEVDFAGRRGWAVIAVKSDSKGEFRLESRTVMSRPRIYTLAVTVPSRWGAEAAARYAARHFDSFKLLCKGNKG